MSEFVLAPPPVPSVAVEGSDARFPVRRVFCVGRNYAAHAREMGKDPDREPPFFFTKPADAVCDAGGTVPYPPLTEDLHFEMELVVAIGIGGSNIDPADATGHIWGYGAGIDLTRRDLQAQAKEMGRPWDWAKGFDFSAPCSPLVPWSRCGHPTAGRITLALNGETRQDGNTNTMVYGPAFLVHYLSQFFTLEPGDVIPTGTPPGVGMGFKPEPKYLKAGDVVELGIDGLGVQRQTCVADS